jgi:hypothetical protein
MCKYRILILFGTKETFLSMNFRLTVFRIKVIPSTLFIEIVMSRGPSVKASTLAILIKY